MTLEFEMDFEDAFFDTNDFKLTGKKLGDGGFGSVYTVQRKTDKKLFAAKIINSTNLARGIDQISFLRESEILHKLKHPYIVKFHGVNFHSFDDNTKLEPTILTEYVVNGSLKDVLNKERKNAADPKWNATQKYICLLGIADAMRYLHSNRILHRDLKPHNVLMDENYFPRLCDFGISRCFKKESSNGIKLSHVEYSGTPIYMAPELFDDDPIYGSSIDVYAFSIVAYEIVTGLEPYVNNYSKMPSFYTLTSNIISGDRPKFNDKVTKKMKTLLEQCWSSEPYDRPTFSEIFRLLSTDFSYFKEELENDKIESFLNQLKRSSEYQISSMYDNERLSGFLFDITKLEKQEKVGEGSVGTFYRSILKGTEKPAPTYNLKVIKELNTQSEQRDFFNSIEIQSSLIHPSILQLVGFSIPNENDNFFNMVTQFPKNGSLQKMIDGEEPDDWLTIRSICIFGIAAGMAFIHQHNIVLNDLRTESVFLDDQNCPKIGGFVNAFFLKQGSLCRKEPTNYGIPCYMAPELIKIFLDADFPPFSHKVDVYSYAIVLFKLLTKRSPYKKIDAKVFAEIAKGKRPTFKKGEKIDQCYIDLIKSCWNKDPDERPSFIKIVQMFLKDKDKYFDLENIDKARFDNYVELVIKDLSFW